MSETKGKYAQKRLIHVTKEQEERMAQQAMQKAQAFASEAAEIQNRRCEIMVALLASEVTKNGLFSVTAETVKMCQEISALAVDADAKQKWEDLKKMFVEIGVGGPQPHLEWAAKQVGVTLFDPLPEEPRIINPSIEDLTKVIQ